jgi:large subunit ribosomal protein L16
MNKFLPKNYKYKKIRKRVRINKLLDYRSSSLKRYDYGLKILNNSIISNVVLEAARRSISRKIKKMGSLKINGFPFIPVTTKSLGVRMGKGVGNISS